MCWLQISKNIEIYAFIVNGVIIACASISRKPFSDTDLPQFTAIKRL